MEFWTAITIGLVGSFHCVGMCGPIAFALPIHDRPWASKATGSFVYNAGRIITYAALGSTFGLLGAGFVMAGFQQWLSIGLGALILLSVLLPAVFMHKLDPSGPITRNIGKLKNAMRKLFGRKSNSALLSIGLLNGLLPCGLVYVAVAGAIATGGWMDGAIYMAAFGLGTLPMMWVVSMAGNLVSIQFRNGVRRALPFVVAAIGILFILRGMNLGIPYISPQMSETCATATCCHPGE